MDILECNAWEGLNGMRLIRRRRSFLGVLDLSTSSTASAAAAGRGTTMITGPLINYLLELLDGAAKSCGVIVVGATNNPGSIDPALLRSGRLERHIAIEKPDTAALIGIPRHHLKDDLEAVITSAPVEATTRISVDNEAEQPAEQHERVTAKRAARPLPGKEPQDADSEPQLGGSTMRGRQ